MLVDAYQRPIKDLRISVTDRCNFRCTYCMPLDSTNGSIKRKFSPLKRLPDWLKLAIELGVEKIRLTGGEPLVRQDLPLLIEKLAASRGCTIFV